eukprot:4585892-Pyramimonas_sp.AAC.1
MLGQVRADPGAHKGAGGARRTQRSGVRPGGRVEAPAQPSRGPGVWRHSTLDRRINTAEC